MPIGFNLALGSPCIIYVSRFILNWVLYSSGIISGLEEMVIRYVRFNLYFILGNQKQM